MRKFAPLAAGLFVVSATLFGTAHTADAKANTSSHYTVQSGDSLSKIAKKHDTTYVRLFDANKIIKNPNVINAGWKLRIPSKDEKLAHRATPDHKTSASAPVRRTAPQQQSVQPHVPKQTVKPTTQPKSSGSGVWDKLAQCESGGNWSTNTGNGYYGGLQFTDSTWSANGGSGSPQSASRAEQIEVAKNVQASQGWGAWPACSASLGL